MTISQAPLRDASTHVLGAITTSASSPLRVLHCLWSGDIGGAERAVYQLVRAQIRDPELAPAILFAQGTGPYLAQARALGCPVIVAGETHRFRRSRAVRVARLMRGYDVHHFHSAEPLMMLASIRCRSATRVYTHRGGTTSYSPKKRLRHALVGAFLRRHFHGFSGNTQHAAHCAADLFGLGGRQVQVTYNAVDLDLLRPTRRASEVRAELHLDGDAFVLGTAANLKPWKRIETLLHAASSAGDPRLRILIVGDGGDRRRLEGIARTLGIESSVIFTGLTNSIGDYLQVMDAFALPSTALESFGNAAVEAMGAGLPTIVFADGGGLLEHIEHPRTGFVVRGQAEFDETVRLLLDDPALGRDVGERAGAVVRERYGADRAVTAYSRLYASALQVSGRFTDWSRP